MGQIIPFIMLLKFISFSFQVLCSMGIVHKSYIMSMLSLSGGAT